MKTSKKKAKRSSPPSGENVAPRDFRGRDGEINKPGCAKAPDGISGDWGRQEP